MNCFYHQDRVAVGGCKSCGKGLCPECAIDLQKGLACRGRCETDVQSVIDLVDRNIKFMPQTARLLESGRKVKSSASVFNLVTGTVFIAWGLSDTERFSFMLVLGVCFFAYGLLGIFQARRFAKDRQQPSDAP